MIIIGLSHTVKCTGCNYRSEKTVQELYIELRAVVHKGMKSENIHPLSHHTGRSVNEYP